MHWTAADLYLTRCNFVKAISSRAPPCDWGPQFSFYTRINITILCVFMFVSTRWCRQISMRARGEPLHASDWRARIGMSRQDIQAKEQRGLTVSPVLVCTKCSGSPTTQTIFKKNEETKKWKRMTETFQRGLFILESTAAEDDLLRLICSWSMASISVNYKMNTGAHTDQVVDAPFFFLSVDYYIVDGKMCFLFLLEDLRYEHIVWMYSDEVHWASKTVFWMRIIHSKGRILSATCVCSVNSRYGYDSMIYVIH